MAKTIQELFGLSAWHGDGQLVIDYLGLGETLGLSPDDIPENPTPEALAATLLLVINLGARQATDEDGFVIQDDTQAVVSPNSEPRRTFVDRNGETQLKTTLTFDIYTRDVSSFNPGQIIGFESNSSQ